MDQDFDRSSTAAAVESGGTHNNWDRHDSGLWDSQNNLGRDDNCLSVRMCQRRVDQSDICGRRDTQVELRGMEEKEAPIGNLQHLEKLADKMCLVNLEDREFEVKRLDMTDCCSRCRAGLGMP